MTGVNERGTRAARALRVGLTLAAVYAPYSALLFMDRSCEDCLWTLAKIWPLGPGLLPASVVSASLRTPSDVVRFGGAALITAIALAAFGAWAWRGSRWSALVAFVVNLPLGIGLANAIRA